MRGAWLLLAAAVSSCAGSGGLPSVEFPARGVSARVEVAATPEQRERGLMGRETLPADQGMLFAYPEDRALGFWMKNCPSPLSAAFMDREGVVLNIEEMAPGVGVPDDDLKRYESRGEARFVLEMEGGWFGRRGIRPGDRADLHAALRGVVAR